MGAYLGFDTTKGDDEQFFSEEDNQTYRDYFMETALKSAQRDLALAEQAVKAAVADYYKRKGIPYDHPCDNCEEGCCHSHGGEE